MPGIAMGFSCNSRRWTRIKRRYGFTGFAQQDSNGGEARRCPQPPLSGRFLGMEKAALEPSGMRPMREQY